MVPDSLLNLNGNMMAAVDVETSGCLDSWHEILQIAVLPLNSQLEPAQGISPFYMHLCPEYPERRQAGAMRVNGLEIDWLLSHGIEQTRAADLLDEWFQGLRLPFRKRLVPLAHNWSFERGFLTHWLGEGTFDVIFNPNARDTNRVAALVNDAAGYHGMKIPFGSMSLGSMCKKYGIANSKEHDALADCVATAKLYREIILGFGRK